MKLKIKRNREQKIMNFQIRERKSKVRQFFDQQQKCEEDKFAELENQKL